MIVYRIDLQQKKPNRPNTGSVEESKLIEYKESVNVKLTIDGKTITARKQETVLQCALRHDISIPNL
ncbi:MAG: hypothetical protein GTO41_02140, partial [Burkholderiales bacterium]|nr:hypothetical protein [Burkholderiales bacterium]